MKLPSLLSQFLYERKRLSLPGIGVFTLDASGNPADDEAKEGRSHHMAIVFKRNVHCVADDELIEYIRLHTGKMKPLALADLESYLTLGTELLNIGKPFPLEGIGTLTKDREGHFEFTPGESVPVKGEEANAEKHHEKEARKRSQPEDVSSDIQPTAKSAISFPWLVTFAILAGISLIAWGGYIMYKKNRSRDTENNMAQRQKEAVDKTADVPAATLPVDSTSTENNTKPQVQSRGDSTLYRFVILATYDKAHALRRYNQLLSYDLKINLFTKDSSFFKVYFTFPALPKDTVRIKDSLNREYAHKITIEH